MDESQVTGSASSYARKYALNGLYAIDDVKDPDTNDDKGSEKDKKPPDTEEPPPWEPPPQERKPPTGGLITKPQQKKFYAMCKADDMPDEHITEFKEWLKANPAVDVRDKQITVSGAGYIFDNWKKLRSDWIEAKMDVFS
jgi:hypothetical protein